METIKTWQERRADFMARNSQKRSGPENSEQFMQAEIAELRAALASAHVSVGQVLRAAQPAQAPVDRPLNITAADAEMLVNLMENPLESNDAMKAAFAKFQANKVAPAGKPVAYADPQAFTNFKNALKIGDGAKEWMWAKPDAGLVPLYAAPVANAGQPAGDERAAFEAEMQRIGYNMTMEANKPGQYAFPPMRAAWHAWQARASKT